VRAALRQQTLAITAADRFAVSRRRGEDGRAGEDRSGGRCGRRDFGASKAANAIDLAFAEQFAAGVSACSNDPAIRCVLLRAEGRFFCVGFCVGGDATSFADAGPAMPDLLRQETDLLHAACSELARMMKPLVVAVQGFAAEIGFSLAMVGDIVLASEEAQFTLAYTAVGLTPDGGASWLLPRLVGLRRAQQMLLLNTRLDAQAALAAGLVTEVVTAAELTARANVVPAELAAGPTQAYGRIRSLLLSSLESGLDDHLDREARAIAASGGTADGQEGVAALLAKCRAVFVGD